MKQKVKHYWVDIFLFTSIHMFTLSFLSYFVSTSTESSTQKTTSLECCFLRLYFVSFYTYISRWKAGEIHVRWTFLSFYRFFMQLYMCVSFISYYAKLTKNCILSILKENYKKSIHYILLTFFHSGVDLIWFTFIK